MAPPEPADGHVSTSVVIDLIQEHKKDREELEEKLREAEKKNEQLHTELAEVRDEKDNLRTEIAGVRSERDNLRKNLEDMRQEKEEEVEKKNDLRKDLEDQLRIKNTESKEIDQRNRDLVLVNQGLKKRVKELERAKEEFEKSTRQAGAEEMEKIKQEYEKETEKLKQELRVEWKKMREREDLHVKVNERVHREHTELTAEVQELRKWKLSPKPTYAKVVSCGVQTVPVPATPAPVLKSNGEGKRIWKDGKRKDKEGDLEVENRFREYEDLSDYEAEPPAANKPKTTPTTKAVRAIIVHGVACGTPTASTIQIVERVLGRGAVAGARWLLAPPRRAGKTASSMVYFLTRPVSMLERGQKLKMHGRWHLVDEYDFSRGRK